MPQVAQVSLPTEAVANRVVEGTSASMGDSPLGDSPLCQYFADSWREGWQDQWRDGRRESQTMSPTDINSAALSRVAYSESGSALHPELFQEPERFKPRVACRPKSDSDLRKMEATFHQVISTHPPVSSLSRGMGPAFAEESNTSHSSPREDISQEDELCTHGQSSSSGPQIAITPKRKPYSVSLNDHERKELEKRLVPQPVPGTVPLPIAVYVDLGSLREKRDARRRSFGLKPFKGNRRFTTC